MRMPPVGKIGRSARTPKGYGFLFRLLAILAIFGLCISWILIYLATGAKRERQIAAMLERGEAVCAALEGSLAFPSRESEKMLGRMARKAGISWIAITDSHGQILASSDRKKIVRQLGSLAETVPNNPDAPLQGRFNPANPDIFETWKSFQAHPGEPADGQTQLIFLGIRAKGFEHRLESFARELWLISALVILAMLAATAIAFFLRRYRASFRQLADTRALAEQVIKSYPAALFVADAAGKIILANGAGRQLLEKIDANSLASIAGIDWQNLVESLDKGMPANCPDIELHDKNGASLPSRLTATRIRDAAGNISGILLILQDIAEIRKLEKKLRQSERLSSFGKLAAGLAHEIRNPLSSIRGYAAYLAEKTGSDPVVGGAAELLAEETERLNRVLSDLLGFARAPALTCAAVNLAQIVERAVALARADADAKNIMMEKDLHTDDATSQGDGDRLLQALLNLLINAIQASPEGGKIYVSLILKEDALQIRVRDEGSGLSEEVAAQIFTPYFTTRSRGTGLGLPIAQQIMEAHNGTIYAENAAAGGAVFTMELPRAGCPAPHPMERQ